MPGQEPAPFEARVQIDLHLPDGLICSDAPANPQAEGSNP
jgi:hypothetical protein